MDYSRITADPVRGPEIGRLYMDASPYITTLARCAYRSFAAQVDRQFGELIKRVDVAFTEQDPYGCAEEMFADVSRGRLSVYRTSPDQAHPLLSAEQNDRFRAVHDFYGHFRSGRGFDRHGEEAAWVRHSQMFTGLGRRAMTSETRGQSSALCWLLKGTDQFPPQKAVLLPDWVSVIPEQWSR